MLIRNARQLQKYQEAAKISLEILWQLRDSVKAGVFPIEIDEQALVLCKKYGVEPAFFNVMGYEAIYGYNTCISVNDVAVHGIPSKVDLIKPGDIVKVDFGIIYQEYYTDHCFTVGVKPVVSEHLQLMKVGREATIKAACQAIVGNRVGDIGFVMQESLQPYGYTTLKQFNGHGLGRSLHDEPMIPTYGKRHAGSRLKEGMVLCVEAQIGTGSGRHLTDADGWTSRTDDGKVAVMFEYMVVVKPEKPLFLTDNFDWELEV